MLGLDVLTATPRMSEDSGNLSLLPPWLHPTSVGWEPWPIFPRSDTESSFPHTFLRGKLIGNNVWPWGLQKGRLVFSSASITFSLLKHSGKSRLEVNHIPKGERVFRGVGCVCVCGGVSNLLLYQEKKNHESSLRKPRATSKEARAWVLCGCHLLVRDRKFSP